MDRHLATHRVISLCAPKLHIIAITYCTEYLHSWSEVFSAEQTDRQTNMTRQADGQIGRLTDTWTRIWMERIMWNRSYMYNKLVSRIYLHCNCRSTWIKYHPVIAVYFVISWVLWVLASQLVWSGHSSTNSMTYMGFLPKQCLSGTVP